MNDYYLLLNITQNQSKESPIYSNVTFFSQGLQTKNNEENGGVETEESQKAEEIDVEKGEKENCNGVNALENNKMQENAESSNE